MKLSGSLPAGGPVRRQSGIAYQNMSTLSISRNYFTGTTEVLDGSSKMQTLILSSNYFSCDVAQMDGAAQLSVGTFIDPTVRALKQYSARRQENCAFCPAMYEDLTGEYENMCLVFAGIAPPDYLKIEVMCVQGTHSSQRMRAISRRNMEDTFWWLMR